MATAGSSFLVPGIKSVGGTLRAQDFGVPGKNGQIANPNLSPETGLGSDLGVDYQLFKDVKLGVRGFANFLDNAIITNEVSVNPSQSMDVNAGGATSYGVEFEIKHRVLPWLQWFGNYTYTHARVSNGNKPDRMTLKFPLFRTNMGNVGVIVEFPKNFYGSALLYMLPVPFTTVTQRAAEQKFDPYEVVNMKLTKVLTQTEKHYLDLHLDLYNLTNNNYKMPWAFQGSRLFRSWRYGDSILGKKLSRDAYPTDWVALPQRGNPGPTVSYGIKDVTEPPRSIFLRSLALAGHS